MSETHPLQIGSYGYTCIYNSKLSVRDHFEK